MSQPKTNRELYLAFAELSDSQRDNARTLDEFLRAMLNRCEKTDKSGELTTTEFLELIAGGFIGQPVEYQPAWALDYDKYDPEAKGFLGFYGSVLQQIVDLQEMAENGQLDDEFRSFGIDAPRGSRWYNFDPITYVECGLAGTFGGCRIDDKTVEIDILTWEDLSHFVWAGQHYE